jgi:phage-related protein
MIHVRKLKEVSDFISTLPDKDAAVCDRYITLLQEHGWKLRDPFAEHTEGICILRPSGKGGEYRLFYDFVKGAAFIVHAIHKKTRKLNRKDIELAKERIALVKRSLFITC